MFQRFSLLALAAGMLLAFRPEWIVVDWSSEWFMTAPLDTVVAAVLRVSSAALAGFQAAAIAVWSAGRALGSDGLQRLGRRFVLPILRGVAPLALVAGTALPAIADVRLPVTPPIVTQQEPDHVVVRAGDSMWTIAEGRANGAVGPYWTAVVALNRSRFANVDVIHPGDTVLLPPVTPAG